MKIQNLLATLVAASLLLAACGAATPPEPETLPSPVQGDKVETATLGKGQEQEVSTGDVNLRVHFDGENFNWTQYDPTTGWGEWKNVVLTDGESYIIPWGEVVLGYTEPPLGTAIVTKRVVAHCHFTVGEYCLIRLVQTSLKVKWVP